MVNPLEPMTPADDPPSLKCCPFCDGLNLIVQEMARSGFTVGCKDCEAMGPNRFNAEGAVADWNERPGVRT